MLSHTLPLLEGPLTLERVGNVLMEVLGRNSSVGWLVRAPQLCRPRRDPHKAGAKRPA